MRNNSRERTVRAKADFVNRGDRRLEAEEGRGDGGRVGVGLDFEQHQVLDHVGTTAVERMLEWNCGTVGARPERGLAHSSLRSPGASATEN
jgi:hypothetical protein